MLSAAYVAVGALILAFWDPSVALRFGADAPSWYWPALSMIGQAVPAHAPPDFAIYRSPGVPGFYALVMSLAGGPSFTAIAVGQLVLLYLCGLTVRATVADWFPGYGTAAMALTLFNPSLLAKAFFVESEIVGAFTFTLVLWRVLRYAKGDVSWRNAVLLGVALGIACLARTNPVYFIYMLPAALPLVSRLQGHAIPLRLACAKGFVAALLAVAVVAPWAAHVYAQTGSLGWSALISPRAEQDYMFDELAVLEGTQHGIGRPEAVKRLRAPDQAIARFVAASGDAWWTLSETERQQRLKAFETRLMFDYPPGVWLKALTISQVQFFFGAGSGAWHNLLGVYPGALGPLSYMPLRDWSLLRSIVAQAPPAAVGLSLVCFAFVLMMRLALVVGVIDMGRRRMWGPLLILGVAIAYVALTTLFQGHARYRASVEPAFTMLAVAGFAAMRRRCNERRADLPAAAR